MCAENQIYKGLDDDESTFLNFVAERQAEMEAQQFAEEMEQIKEYRISFSMFLFLIVDCECSVGSGVCGNMKVYTVPYGIPLTLPRFMSVEQGVSVW